MRAAGMPDLDELMLRESLLEPVGAAFVGATSRSAYALTGASGESAGRSCDAGGPRGR